MITQQQENEKKEQAVNQAMNWLGFVKIPDSISRVTKTTESAEADRKRYRQKKSPYEIQTVATRKLIRGLTVCLNSGMKNNVEIRRLLMLRGFLNKKDGRIITRQTVNYYLRCVRERLGLVRKDKKTMICEMFDQGEGIEQIAESINSTPMYVYQTLKNNGYEVKRPTLGN